MQKKIIITVIVMLLIGATVAIGVWYYMEEKANGDKSFLEEQKAKLEERITQVGQAFEGCDTDCCDIENEELVMIYALREGGYGSSFINAIPEDSIEIDDNWASVSFLPVRFSESAGYEIPAMGGLSYVLEKTDDCIWEVVGSITETGVDDDIRSRLDDIPASIVSEDLRGEPI